MAKTYTLDPPPTKLTLQWVFLAYVYFANNFQNKKNKKIRGLGWSEKPLLRLKTRVQEAKKTMLMDITRKMFQEETGGKVLFITKEPVSL